MLDAVVCAWVGIAALNDKPIRTAMRYRPSGFRGRKGNANGLPHSRHLHRRLSAPPAQEQKAVKTSAFDMQLDPAGPGLQFHRIDAAKDPNFWSVRVNRDIRIIVHKTAASLLLAYVDHHDKAYAWAERRRIEAHPRTGAVQIVESRARVEESTPALFKHETPERPTPEPVLFRGLWRRTCYRSGCPRTGSSRCARQRRAVSSISRRTCRRRPPKRSSNTQRPAACRSPRRPRPSTLCAP